MPHVFNELAQLVGRVEGDGRVYTVQGQSVGAVQPDGSVYDATGQLVGGVSAAGLIYDRQGTQVGKVHPDGGSFVWPRTYVGYVGTGLSLVAVGWAALLLLLNESQPCWSPQRIAGGGRVGGRVGGHRMKNTVLLPVGVVRVPGTPAAHRNANGRSDHT